MKKVSGSCTLRCEIELCLYRLFDEDAGWRECSFFVVLAMVREFGKNSVSSKGFRISRPLPVEDGFSAGDKGGDSVSYFLSRIDIVISLL